MHSNFNDFKNEMEAKNLRIGNLVTWIDEDNPDNAILTLTGIYLNDSIWVEWIWKDGQTDNTDCDLESIKGIPLTEKWIKELGFETDKTHDKYFTISDGISISMADHKIRFIQGNFVCQLVIREMKYVHELQNLFFAITGNELDLKNENPTDANNVLVAAVCPKCRTQDFDNCHSIRCPMRKEEVTIKTEWDIRKCFEQLRFDKSHHLGLGDIRLTIAQQEEICELVERFYRCH